MTDPSAPLIPEVIPPVAPARGLRVCAYCRVSTAEETQAGSLEAQAAHWRSEVAGWPGAELVGVFIEKGVSGTKARTRPELMRLMDLAAGGGVDLVVTKSISRFSRNTADCISLVRTLQRMGVRIFFEKERIDTGRMDSEVMLSIMASFAADESRSLSANVKWGYGKRFRQGVYRYKRPPYGYLCPQGDLEICEAEAQVVREIFDRAVGGESPARIAQTLNDRGVPTKYERGVWQVSTVTAIVQNITYTGDALFQKTARDEAFEVFVNTGQEDRYFCAEHHPALVSREAFILANERLGDMGLRARYEAWREAPEEGRVKVIPADAVRAPGAPEKLRVAAYCRVSTDSDEQEGSYAAQCAHYQSLIGGRDNWTLVGIYADEGITGTSTARRESFRRMIEDCEAGKIDLVLTKSISRFARNTLDCLEHLRKLRALKIGVEFEKEGIHTLDAKGELLITVMASIAQQESASISQNVRLGIQYRFQQGRGVVNAGRFLGYNKGRSGQLVVDPKQAAVVRRIFRLFLEGQSPDLIAGTLRREGVRSGAGRTSWPASSVRYILMNEKYAGDWLMQKTYVADFLNHRSVRNRGALPMYRVEGAHEGIVPRTIFDAAQEELFRRSGGAERFGSRKALNGRTWCACGRRLVRGRREGADWTCGCGRRIADQAVKRAVLERLNHLPEYREALEARLRASPDGDRRSRACAAALAVKARLALEVADQIEGVEREAEAGRESEELFWRRTRRDRTPGPLKVWIDEDVVRLVERVTVGDEVRVRLRAGMEI